MSKIEDVARGLLVDAFITYAAICREKGHTGEHAFDSWSEALSGMIGRINNTVQREGVIADAVLGDDVSRDDEHVEMLIEERRGLIRDTMREEMAELETASPSPEDVEGIRDERQG
jgi:hypothetical protein